MSYTHARERLSRRTLLSAAVAVPVVAVTACGGDEQAPSAARVPTVAGGADLSAVTLTIGDQKGGAESLLEAAGLLEDLPYEIEWTQFPSGPPLLEALNAGVIDVGSTGDAPPIFAASQGAELRIVAASRSVPAGAAVLVPQDSTIASPEALRGRSVAVAKGSSAHYHLLRVLEQAGLSFDDITPSYLQPADGLAAFTSGKVDAWVIWDPFTAIAEQTTGARILVDGKGLVGGLGFVEATPAALADAGKRAALQDCVTRLAQARAWTLEHKDEWAAAWAEVAGLPESAARTTVERADQQYVPIDDALVAEEQAAADAFYEAGLIPRRVDIDAITDRRFNDAVVQAG